MIGRQVGCHHHIGAILRDRFLGTGQHGIGYLNFSIWAELLELGDNREQALTRKRHVHHQFAGFGTHPHRDMEIISYVLSGELAHKDSMGTGSVIRPGDVQRMSAGSGVRHSEFNNSPTEGLHFLQIWIKPDVFGIEPSYEEKHFADSEKQGRLRLIASSDGRDGSVLIHQDASIYAGRFDAEDQASMVFKPGRRSYVHVVRGEVRANGVALGAGDALKITETPALHIDGGRKAEVLVFDLP